MGTEKPLPQLVCSHTNGRSPVCTRICLPVRVGEGVGECGRVSVGGVSHHAKLSNPRVGAVRGLLKRTCWARAHMCTRACELIEEVPFTRRSGAGV